MVSRRTKKRRNFPSFPSCTHLWQGQSRRPRAKCPSALAECFALSPELDLFSRCAGRNEEAKVEHPPSRRGRMGPQSNGEPLVCITALWLAHSILLLFAFISRGSEGKSLQSRLSFAVGPHRHLRMSRSAPVFKGWKAGGKVLTNLRPNYVGKGD